VTTCLDGSNKAAGTVCGTNMVCNGSGLCGPCTAGVACTTNPNAACKNGTTSCSTGTTTCVDGGNKAAGTSCGTDKVCNSAGTCVACAAGDLCTTNPGACKVGVTSCSTGARTCVDSANNQQPGTLCGAAQSCVGN